jgi:hypothetical protein
MNIRRRTLAVAVAAVLTVAPALGARASEVLPPSGAAPGAQEGRSIEATALAAAETAGGWCARGGAFAVLFSAAFSVPSMIFGGGAPYTLMRAGSAALMGCGMAVAWRSAAQGVASIDAFLHPFPPIPADPPPRALPAATRPVVFNIAYRAAE